jgi:predicted kinase
MFTIKNDLYVKSKIYDKLMKIEDDRIFKAHVLDIFIKHNKNLVYSMKSTRHAFSDDHMNIHHLEDDVWTHTLMCLNTIQLVSEPFVSIYIKPYYDHLGKPCPKYKEINFALCIAALGHDIGKCYTRFNHQYGKVIFNNHAQQSVQPTYDMVTNTFGVINEPLVYALYVINYHDRLRNIVNLNSLYDLLLRNPIMYYMYDRLNKADLGGRFTKVLPETKEHETVLHEAGHHIHKNKHVVWNTDKHISFMCGIPGSGKTTMVNDLYNDGDVVISYDKIRCDKFMEKYPNRIFTYNDAFNYCQDHNIGLHYILEKRMADSFGKTNHIIIDNTNVTLKARRIIMESVRKHLPGYKETAYFIMTNRSTAIKRCKKRNDEQSKDIPVKDINRMAQLIELPTYYDGFTDIDFIVS